jgi:hypothetical protein
VRINVREVGKYLCLVSSGSFCTHWACFALEFYFNFASRKHSLILQRAHENSDLVTRILQIQRKSENCFCRTKAQRLVACFESYWSNTYVHVLKDTWHAPLSFHRPVPVHACAEMGSWKHFFFSWFDSSTEPQSPVWGFSSITHTPHSLWHLWTHDQPVIETSTWQHTTATRDRHQFLRWDSNPQSQQARGHRPRPLAPRPMGPDHENISFTN